MKGLFKLISFIMLLLFVSGAQANPFVSDDLNAQEAKAELETIRFEITNNSLDYRTLHQFKSRLNALQEIAMLCIKKNETNIQEIKLLLEQHKSSSMLSNDHHNFKYLEKEKQLRLKQIATCGLIEYKARHLEIETDASIHHVSSNQMFFKKLLAWKSEAIPSFFGSAIDANTRYQFRGIDKLKLNPFFMSLIIIMIISLIVAYGLYRLCAYALRNVSFSKPMLTLCKYYLPFLTTLFGLNIFINWTLQNAIPKPFIALLVQLLFIYVVIYTFIRINLVALTHKKRWFSRQLKRHVIGSLTVLLTIISVGSFVSELTKEHILPYTFITIFPFLYIGLVCISFLWVIRVGLYVASTRYHYSTTSLGVVKAITSLCFLIALAASWFNYTYFAIFFIHNLIFTTFIGLMVWQGSYLLNLGYYILNDTSHPASKKIHALLGDSTQKFFIEFYILRAMFIMGLFARALLVLSLSWGIPKYYIELLRAYLNDGFYIFGIPIDVINTLRGLVAFCIIIILGRIIGAAVARNQSFALRKNAQNTIVTLINYVAFTFGVFSTYIISGGSLSRLAFIAGALSVGIGFGLKGIAADLVSGLILLLSKSIRPGDHIVIDQTEGFVQKIRILTTEIKTLSKSNVMIPNAQFLSTFVTNYTYKDKLSRVTCQVMLNDINDLEKARKVLVDVALQHTEVIKKGKNKPEVLIELKPARATLDIILTLGCVIKDVDERYRVTSDINFAVLQALKKAKISLKMA